MNVKEYLTPLMVAAILGLSGWLISANNAITILNHEMTHMQDKLDKSEFNRYKDNDADKDMLTIDLLKKDIALVEHKILEIKERSK